MKRRLWPFSLIAITIATFAISKNSFGEDCPPAPAAHQDLQAQAEKLLDTMEKSEWSAEPEDVRKSACFRSRSYTNVEVERELENSLPRHDRKVTRDVFGIHLVNESETLARLLEMLLQADGSNQPEFVETGPKPGQTKFTSTCDKVLCAVKDPALFGPKLGPRLLLLLQKYGFNASHLAARRASKWKDDEIDDVLFAVKDFPPNRFPVTKNRQFVHHEHGISIDRDGKTYYANSAIRVFDNWDKLERERRRSLLSHELAHIVGGELALDTSDEWLKFSKWKKRTVIEKGEAKDKWTAERPKAVPSKYGETDPLEDFAESVVAYRYNPGWFRYRSPGKYLFLKYKVFQGYEYRSDWSCHSPGP